jgi:aminomethyltransferase
MVKKSPFFARTSELNKTMLWEHWAGYIAATKYQYSEKVEYYAVRNSAGLLDTSPLYKYRIQGPDAERFLSGVLARDIRTCQPGKGQYTIWCDDDGFLLEDGVILRIRPQEYLLTAADPNLHYLQNLVGFEDVQIEDISENYGILAIQGPHSGNILKRLAPAIEGLDYFGVDEFEIGGVPVIISRTGFTGDLGYEVWTPTESALSIWDAVSEAGEDYNLTPLGLRALSMARIEAGMLLIEVDFNTARFAWTDEQRSTPIELGMDWMFRKIGSDDRTFIGRKAIESEIREKSSRWKMVGLAMDWQAYEALYNDMGLVALKDHLPVEEAMAIYDDEGQVLGYATSFMYSPMLKNHIALAKVPIDRAKQGQVVMLELMINNIPRYVPCRVVRTPFYNPAHKTARGIH